MKKGLASLAMAFLACWPFPSSADQGLQSRFEKELNDTRSISNVDIEWLDTLTIPNPPAYLATNGVTFSRTFQYSFIASGTKYRATCKLISGTQTNLMKLRESVFDGTTYFEYSADNRHMSQSSAPMPGGSGDSWLNPLIAPFIFLRKQSDGHMASMLRFTEVFSLGITNKVVFKTVQNSNGLLEVVFTGLPGRGQPKEWEIGINEAGDSFAPKVIRHVAPGQTSEEVYDLQNYTNLGAYHFPAKIAWNLSSYPPTLQASGTVSVISARIPDQIADSVFKMENEEKEAVAVWDRDQKKFIKSARAISNSNGSDQARPNIYDELAHGSKQIADALAMAREGHKQVLLQFGANWCSPCQQLHTLFEQDKGIAKILKSDYVVVMIDMNKGHNKDIDTKYGHPTRFGLPAIMVLDADGNQLVTQDIGKLAEGDNASPEKVANFLKEWAPKR